MPLESLPGQRPLFSEAEEEAGTFMLSDANVDLLAEVAEIDDEAVRPLLFLSLVCLFSQDQADSIEAEPGVEGTAWRSQMFPLRWIRRRAMFC